MPRTHAPYPPEFRHQMVELVRTGRPIRDFARDFECHEQTIRNWIRQADFDQGRRDDGMTTDERDELRRLRRENRQLCLELEILANILGGCTRSCGDRNSTIGYGVGLRRRERPLAYWWLDPVANVVQGRLRTCKW